MSCLGVLANPPLCGPTLRNDSRVLIVDVPICCLSLGAPLDGRLMFFFAESTGKGRVSLPLPAKEADDRRQTR